jgi:hypothetical protein
MSHSRKGKSVGLETRLVGNGGGTISLHRGNMRKVLDGMAI